MNQTTVQLNGAIFLYDVARIAGVGNNHLNDPTVVGATGHGGHEGHIMPPASKPPAAKPDKVKPATPPTPPVAKPVERKARSRLRALGRLAKRAVVQQDMVGI